MSVVRYPESMNSTDLQIWDNAAFDNGESEDSSAMFKSSWPHLKPVVFSSTESLDSFSSKENQNPQFDNNRLAIKSHLPFKSIHQQKGRVKSTKTQSSKSKSGNEEDVRDDGKNIDLEIEEIEKEISRLSSRLEALRIEKAEKCVKTAERRAGGGGRVVPAKFMEQKQTGKNGEEKKKVEEAFIMSSKVQTRRRGLSIGPSEIINGGSGARRGGMSLGPVEISAGAIAIAAGKQQESAITPIQAIQNRRKSCFWKLQDIEEEEEGKKMITTTTTTTKERRKSCFLSISPKSRKPNNNNISAAKILQASRKAATTVGSRKTVKREDSIVNSIQPKKLFIDKDGEKSSAAAAAATNKKPLKLPGRIVASRYNNSNNNNQGTNQASAMRKRSLPENNNDQEEDESKRFDKKRSLSVGKSRPTPTQPEIKNSAAATEGRVKKRWQIPSPPPTAAATVISSVVPDLLPNIRTTRCLIETPRDSGPAKRVADLVGRKSYFSIDEELVCQALDFAEEDDEEEEEK